VLASSIKFGAIYANMKFGAIYANMHDDSSWW